MGKKIAFSNNVLLSRKKAEETLLLFYLSTTELNTSYSLLSI